MVEPRDLDDVGLVDARLLDVGRRAGGAAPALAAGRRARRRRRPRRPTGIGERPGAERLAVAAQVAAQRSQEPNGVSFAAARPARPEPRPRCRGPPRPTIASPAASATPAIASVNQVRRARSASSAASTRRRRDPSRRSSGSRQQLQQPVLVEDLGPDLLGLGELRCRGCRRRPGSRSSSRPSR